jgi:hypothetical protein
MASEEQPSRFDLMAAKLRALGMTLRCLPGEYSVNFRNGDEKMARLVEDLDQALEIGRAMAEEAAAARTSATPVRRRWRKRMTPKARRRRFIRAHNHARAGTAKAARGSLAVAEGPAPFWGRPGRTFVDAADWQVRDLGVEIPPRTACPTMGDSVWPRHSRSSRPKRMEIPTHSRGFFHGMVAELIAGDLHS